MEYTPITINNIEFMKWTRAYRESNKGSQIVHVPSCFTRRRFDKYYGPVPNCPVNYSSTCLCLICSNYTLLTFDETLVDQTRTGSDKKFKLLINQYIYYKDKDN